MSLGVGMDRRDFTVISNVIEDILGFERVGALTRGRKVVRFGYYRVDE